MKSEQSYELTIKELQTAIAEKREEILSVLTILDDMEFQSGFELAERYVREIGCYEVEEVKMEFEVRRAKRKLTLLNQAKNRGESIDTEAIEEELDKEFSEWEAQIQAAIQRQIELLGTYAGVEYLSETDSKQLKKLYRAIAKRLHPDVSPNQEEYFLALFLSAQAAYAKGDLSTLQAIEISTRHLDTKQALEQVDIPSDEDGSKALIEQLSVELVLLETVLQAHKARLEEKRNEFPFIMVGLLADADAIKKRVSIIQNNIDSYTEMLDYYQKKIAEEF